jgi:hypothetical protein
MGEEQEVRPYNEERMGADLLRASEKEKRERWGICRDGLRW